MITLSLIQLVGLIRLRIEQLAHIPISQARFLLIQPAYKSMLLVSFSWRKLEISPMPPKPSIIPIQRQATDNSLRPVKCLLDFLQRPLRYISLNFILHSIVCPEALILLTKESSPPLLQSLKDLAGLGRMHMHRYAMAHYKCLCRLNGKRLVGLGGIFQIGANGIESRAR